MTIPGRSRSSKSETFDVKGRPVVVVKKARKDSEPTDPLWGNPGLPAGEGQTEDDINDASVFRSWAMPDREAE